MTWLQRPNLVLCAITDCYYSGTTAIASISTKKSEFTKSATHTIVMDGGLGRRPHTYWN